MKLAFCLYKYFPFGGLQRDFLRIARESVRRGHQVSVFTTQWDGEAEPDFIIHLIPVKGWQNHTRARYFENQLRQKCTEYDLVIGFNKMRGLDVYYAADTCYQAKARAQRGFWYRLTPRYRHGIASEKAVFHPLSNTKILLLSKRQQVEFSCFYQTPIERFHLLPPGIDPDRVAPDNAVEIRRECRQALSISEDELLLLMVGSGFKTKGLDRALLAFASLPVELKNRTYVYVIGKDKPVMFQHMARSLHVTDRVKFLGGRNDVPRFLLAADLLIHPAYNENTGTVILEALASGLAVLTTDVCGYAEYVEKAKAGMVLGSPFRQAEFNTALVHSLLSKERLQWKKNAMEFTKTADIYGLTRRAVDYIEGLG